jgi:prevent-host-death family protein
MNSWALQDAKAKLSELVDTGRRDGPQIITRCGIDEVAVVPFEQRKRMGGMAKPRLLEVPAIRPTVCTQSPRPGPDASAKAHSRFVN